MRDPKRIDKFCAMLAKTWHKVPDWRFFSVHAKYNGRILLKRKN